MSHEGDRTQPGAVDEVGRLLGPDEEGRGLLDAWTHSAITHSGLTHSGWTGEATGPLGDPGPAGPTSRIAALARLAAGLDRLAAPGRFDHAEGRPCEAVKRLIAEEPLELLPGADEILPLPRPLREASTDRPTELPPEFEALAESELQAGLPENTDPTALTPFPRRAGLPRAGTGRSPAGPWLILLVGALLILVLALGLLTRFKP